MSQHQLDDFYEKLRTQPERLHGLLQGVSGSGELIDRALGEARAQGHAFERAQVEAWVMQKMGRPADSGELSDTQLEEVAGGKSQGQSASTPVQIKTTSFVRDYDNPRIRHGW